MQLLVYSSYVTCLCKRNRHKCEKMKQFKRKSKEYLQYITDVVHTYNTNGKKTLLITCDNAYPLVDGVWRVLENCSNILQRDYQQFNVLILAPDFKGMVYVDKVPVLSVRSKYIKFLHYQCALPMFDGQMKKIVKNLRVDMIHAHSPFLCGQFARKLHLKRKVPMVATFHSQFKQDFVKALKLKGLANMLLKYIMRVFNSADEVWTMHTASRDTLFSYGFKGNCRLMPNATCLKPLQDYQSVRQNFRQSHNIGEQTCFIFVGRLITQKGILFIVDVLEQLRDQGVPFKMFFLGDGPDADRLKHKIAEKHLEQQVSVEGNILDTEEISRFYAGADLFLFPSLYDVSSIVQIEAATYKTPVVFAEGSVTSCTVTDKVNGWLLPFDVKQYAQGVAQIIQSGQIPVVGENALRDLHVEWEDIVERNVQAYTQCMNSCKQSKVE